MEPLLGWDIARLTEGKEARLRAPALPLRQHVLYRPHTPGGEHTCTDLETRIDIWHLDPRLTVIGRFFHRLASGATLPAEPAANLIGSVEAWALAKSGNPSEGAIELFQFPAEELFHNAGDLDDGCELSTGMDGIRFKFFASTAGGEGGGFLSHELVATLVAIPNIQVGCVELAQAMVERLEVDLPSTKIIPLV